MLDTLDTTTGWVAGTDAANITQNTTTVKQGAASLEWDKTGGTSATSFVRKKYLAPSGIGSLQKVQQIPNLRFYVYHANFTNVTTCYVKLCYRVDSTGAPDVWERYDLTSFSAAAWNQASIALDSPTSSSATTVTDDHRSRLIMIELGVVMAAAANTITDLLWDCVLLFTGGTKPYNLLVKFNNEHLLLPPPDIWETSFWELTDGYEGPQAVERAVTARRRQLRFGWKQIREVHKADSQVHSMEEALRRFETYAAANQGFAVAFPGMFLCDTTLNGAIAAGDTKIVVTSATDFSFAGLTTTFEAASFDGIIGPNAARQWDRCRFNALSGTTVGIERAVAHAHESGVAVRALGHYPNLAKVSPGPCVIEDDDAVRFEMLAREAA